LKLKKDVKLFLKSLPFTCIFNAANLDRGLVGSMRGKLTFFLVIEHDKNLSHSELKLSETIRRSGGDFFTVRSMEDITELSKIRGWYD
jgi:hypothetical protein